MLIDIPKDVQLQMLEFDEWPSTSKDIRAAKALELSNGLRQEDVKKVADLINKSQRPFLYFGGGVTFANAHKELSELSIKAQMPSSATLMGLGCLPPQHPLYMGMLGMHGSIATNTLIEEADLLLAIGVRFDDRATGNEKLFARNAKIAHIDIDPAEINKIRSTDAFILSDAKTAIKALLPLVQSHPRSKWVQRAQALWKSSAFLDSPDPFHPRSIIQAIGKIAGPDTIVTTDVGQHQMWAAQVYPVPSPRAFITSGGLGTMGFGLPVALGVSLCNPKKRVICITGDGSLLINIQELATLTENRLNVSVILLDNGHLGLVRQQQELFYNNRFSGEEYSLRLDFAAIARGFGITAQSVASTGTMTEDKKIIQSALEKAINSTEPSFLSIYIKAEEKVLPMVPPGKANIEAIGEF